MIPGHRGQSRPKNAAERLLARWGAAKESRLNVAEVSGSRLLHVAIPLRPKAFYSGSRVAGNQCSIRHQRSVLWRDYCYFRGMFEVRFPHGSGTLPAIRVYFLQPIEFRTQLADLLIALLRTYSRVKSEAIEFGPKSKDKTSRRCE